jgi:hypothetical protein
LVVRLRANTSGTACGARPLALQHLMLSLHRLRWEWGVGFGRRPFRVRLGTDKNCQLQEPRIERAGSNSALTRSSDLPRFPGRASRERRRSPGPSSGLHLDPLWRSTCKARRSSSFSLTQRSLPSALQRLHVRQPIRRSPRLRPVLGRTLCRSPLAPLTDCLPPPLLGRKPPAHHGQLFLGEVNLPAAALARDRDEPRRRPGCNLASKRLAVFRAFCAVAEAGFGARRYLAGKLYSVTHCAYSRAKKPRVEARLPHD